jgi:hypothetical protein
MKITLGIDLKKVSHGEQKVDIKSKNHLDKGANLKGVWEAHIRVNFDG